MDIAYALDLLVPQAIYSGSVTANTEDAYAAIQWEDPREKPTWGMVVEAWGRLTTKDLATVKLEAYYTVDTEAGYARARIVSPGQLVDQEYMFAYQDATEYAAVGYSGPVPDTVQSWADATGNSPQWAADDIISTRAQFKAASDFIRRVRLTAKEGVRAAPEADAVGTIVQQAISALRQVA
jgi:hypothetical protein